MLYSSAHPVISKEDGSFRLENMTAGTYTIRVSKELMFFEPITVKIAPNTPQLPDIITAGCVRSWSCTLHLEFSQNRIAGLSSDVVLTQVQRVWPDLHQPAAWGHEAAGPLQGHSETPRPRQDLRQDHRLGSSGGFLLSGQTWRLQRSCAFDSNSHSELGYFQGWSLSW